MKVYLTVIIIFFTLLLKGQITSLQNIYAWAYQLQYTTPPAIAPDNSFNLFVTDYSYDASAAGAFTATEVNMMKVGGKRVVAYISIGEAEDYRDYWQPAWDTVPPVWLGPENPDWPGNYKVKFWNPQWQSIIINYLDTILAKGYDGIYMDIIDAYYYWQEENPQELQADTLMVNFIEKIRHHVDSVRGNQSFILIPQNGESIIDAPNVTIQIKDRYFNAINAIAVEDVFFPGSNDMNNGHSPDNYRIGLLNEFKNRGKRVFSIEYIDEPAKLNQYIADAQANNYVPYSCTRDLDMICTQLVGLKNIAADYNAPVWSVENGTLNVFFSKQLKNNLVQLFDMQGRAVATGNLSPSGRYTVNNLVRGIYSLSLNSQGFISTYKILVP